MFSNVQLKMTTPIDSIALLDEQAVEEASVGKAAAAEQERARQRLAQVCAALSAATAELEGYRATLFSSHREQIVRLSLEIAAKILAREIGEGNYAIEKIVTDALGSAPSAKAMTLYLNPADAEAFASAAAEQGLSLPSHIAIQADGSVKPAECIIDSELGTVESVIDEHLRQIGEALLGSGTSV